MARRQVRLGGRALRLSALAAALAFGALVGWYAFARTAAPATAYPEVAQLARIDGNWQFEDAANYFRTLALQKGAPYAYRVLLYAQLPPGLDLHLLGHVVGDVLYKQQGIAGITQCTQDFRNACSHSIVINALLSQGEKILSQLGDVCRKAPGGPGAYTMCFHGLGHGVLAYVDYDLPKAVGICETLGTAAYNYEEFPQCVGGTIMEMISGVHDPQTWAKAAQIYFKKDDPLYPCDAPFMPKAAQPMCYTYLTPHLFEAAGGDLGNPQPSDFAKAFQYCEAIPASESENRQACLSGPGKEFVVLAPARDIRNIGDLNDADLGKVASWCALGGTAEATGDCDQSALSSLYWGAENDPGAALRYCKLLSGDRGQACYTLLFSEADFYARGDQRAAFCARVPGELQGACEAALKISA